MAAQSLSLPCADLKKKITPLKAHINQILMRGLGGGVRGGKGGDQAAASGRFQNHLPAGCGEKCEEQQQHCCQRPSAEPLSRDPGVGETPVGCAGALPAHGAAGEGGRLRRRGFGDGLGAKQGMKQVVSSPSSCWAAGGSWFDPQGITLMVAPQEGISSEGLPGASRSRERSVVTAQDAQV